MPRSIEIVSACSAGARGSAEYVFRVSHHGGCEWTVRARHAALADLHERLCAVFAVDSLPPFPARPGIASSLLWSSKESLEDRAPLFKSYFDALCSRTDVANTAAFQVALGISPPQPVKSLRVHRWSETADAADHYVRTFSAWLDIRAESQEAESSAVVDSYQIAARVAIEPLVAPSTIWGCAAHRAVVEFASQRGRTGAEFRIVKELQVPASALAANGVCIEGLPQGAHVEFEVIAVNAIGRSPPVTIRSMVPRDWVANLAGSAALSAGHAATEREDTLQQERTELQQEVDHLARTLEEREQEVVDLRFDVAGLVNKLQNAERLVTRASELSQTTLRKEVNQCRVEVEAQRQVVRDTRQEIEPDNSDDEAAVAERRDSNVSLLGLRRTSSTSVTIGNEEDPESLGCELRQLRHDLQRQREELQHHVDAQQPSPAEAEFEAPLQDLQQVLRKLRASCGDQATDCTDDAAGLQGLREQLEKEKEEFVRLQTAEAEKNKRQSTQFMEQEEELRRRAAQLTRTQAALTEERLALQGSRQTLALVQAHALAMLEKAQNTTGLQQHDLHSPRPTVFKSRRGRGLSEPGPGVRQAQDTEEAVPDKLWSMDWCQLPDASDGVSTTESP